MTKQLKFSIDMFAMLTKHKPKKIPYTPNNIKLYQITIRKNGMIMEVRSNGYVFIKRDIYNPDELDRTFVGDYELNMVPHVNWDIKKNVKHLKRRIEALEYFEGFLKQCWV